MRFKTWSTIVSRLVLSAPLLSATGRYVVHVATQPDPCALLTQAQLQGALGQAFGPASKTSSPAVYAGQSAGTRCDYEAVKQPGPTVSMVMYVDRSPAEAKTTFDKIAAIVAKSRPTGIGDEAYIDGDGALHVLKGKTRYYVSINPFTPAMVKPTADLATQVAGKI